MTAADLRAMLAADHLTHVPGVWDPASAALAVRAGHRAVHLSGAAVSATMLGRPDLSFTPATQIADRAAVLTPALGGVPLLADAAIGYDSPEHAVWTALAYQRAGISGLRLDDGADPALTSALITALAVAVNATFVSQYGMYTLPCPSTTDPRFITFTFSSAKIMVPIRELAFKDGVSGPCYLGVNQTRPGYPNFLGVSFLRSAYVVFDLARNTISLAQAVVNATSAANVLEIDDSPSPAAVTAVGQPAPPPPSGDFDVPVGDDSEGHGSKSGLAPGVIAGVVCGSLSVAVLGAFGALSFWRRRSRQRRKLETKLAD